MPEGERPLDAEVPGSEYEIERPEDGVCVGGGRAEE